MAQVPRSDLTPKTPGKRWFFARWFLSLSISPRISWYENVNQSFFHPQNGQIRFRLYCLQGVITPKNRVKEPQFTLVIFDHFVGGRLCHPIYNDRLGALGWWNHPQVEPWKTLGGLEQLFRPNCAKLWKIRKNCFQKQFLNFYLVTQPMANL